MPDYSKGKIYKIVDLTNNNVYVGSTTQKLNIRLSKHKYDYKRYLDGKYNFVRSFKIIKNENYYIELIEKFECDCKEELFKREGYYAEKLKKKFNVVNKYVAGNYICKTKQEYYKERYNNSKK